MTTHVLEGAGILGGLDVSPETVERRREERRKQEEQEAEAAKQAAELQARCDEIDALALRYLADQLAAENATTRISSKCKRNFAKFEAHIARNGVG